MGRGLGILLVVILFGTIGAGARYALDALPPISWSRPDLPSARVSGTIPPVPRPAPASTGEPMEGTTPKDHYPLSDWTLDQGRAGEVSQAFIAGPQPAPLGDRPLAGDDVLLLAGWAGDPVLGLRFSNVLFSLCDQVVGWAEVKQPRPDVVRYINPSLTRAGWTARLPVALLPRCQPGFLRTWAAGPTGFLYPLQGAVPMPALPPRPRGWMPPARTPLLPQDTPAIHPATLVIQKPTVPLHRCAEKRCQTLSSLPRGTYRAARLDHQPGWSLIITKGQAGWIAEQDFQWRPDGTLPPGLSKPVPKPAPPEPAEALERISLHDSGKAASSAE